MDYTLIYTIYVAFIFISFFGLVIQAWDDRQYRTREIILKAFFLSLFWPGMILLLIDDFFEYFDKKRGID